MATVSLTNGRSNSSNLSAYNFSDCLLGAEAADRYVIVCAYVYGEAGERIPTIKLGGSSGTAMTVVQSSDVAYSQFAIGCLAWPSGSTVDVYVDNQGGANSCHIYVYTAYGLTSTTPTDYCDLNNTLDVIKGGVVVAMSRFSDNAYSATWTNLTEDDYSSSGSSQDVSCASKVYSETAIGDTMECYWTGGWPAPGYGSGIAASFPAVYPFTNPGNVYSSDDSYATIPATSGELTAEVSIDGGGSYGSALTETFTSTEGSQTYGDGSTERWGHTPTRAEATDANLKIRLSHGDYSHVFGGFGFTTGTETITGIEVSIEAKYASSTISIDHIQVKIYYGTSDLQVQAGSVAFATDGRKNGETVGNGTGVLCFYDGSAWIACDTGATAAA